MYDIESVKHAASSGYIWARRHRSWLALALFVLATLLCLAFVDTAFEQIDEPIENVALVASLSHLATIAEGRTGGTILALLVIILAYSRWKQITLSIVAGLAIQTATVEVLKYLSGRPRPLQFDDLTVFYGPGSGFHSFPSGHAAFAFMLATVAAAYFPRWRWLAYGGAAAIALGRVMLDSHFISDVMVGAFVGYMAAYLILRYWPPRESGDETQVIVSSCETSVSWEESLDRLCVARHGR